VQSADQIRLRLAQNLVAVKRGEAFILDNVLEVVDVVVPGDDFVEDLAVRGLQETYDNVYLLLYFKKHELKIVQESFEANHSQISLSQGDAPNLINQEVLQYHEDLVTP
jgi:hypothetical protein